MKLTETQLLLREGEKIVAALGATLAPLTEVVLHDLSRPEHAIVAIANNLSGRAVGDPATEIGLARIADPAYAEVLLNYPNRFPDGRPAKSTSIGLKNSRGEYVAAICLNLDVSLLTALTASLGQLVATSAAPGAVPRETLAAPALDAVRTRLEQFAAALNTTPRHLSPAQRRDAVAQLAAAGLMDLKNAQALVAEILGVARSTVYTYLPNQGKQT